MNIQNIINISIKSIVFIIFLLCLHLCVVWAIRNESGTFQKSILIVAILLYNLLIFLYWYTIKNIKNTNWPPYVSNCPDYYKDITCGDEPNCDISKKTKFKCQDVSGLSGRPSMVEFDINENNCDKYKWSLDNSVYWDGISNLNDPC